MNRVQSPYLPSEPDYFTILLLALAFFLPLVWAALAVVIRLLFRHRERNWDWDYAAEIAEMQARRAEQEAQIAEMRQRLAEANARFAIQQSQWFKTAVGLPVPLNDEGRAFLNAIFAEPFEEVPRQAFADWLDENMPGFEERNAITALFRNWHRKFVCIQGIAWHEETMCFFYALIIGSDRIEVRECHFIGLTQPVELGPSVGMFVDCVIKLAGTEESGPNIENPLADPDVE